MANKDKKDAVAKRDIPFEALSKLIDAHREDDRRDDVKSVVSDACFKFDDLLDRKKADNALDDAKKALKVYSDLSSASSPDVDAVNAARDELTRDLKAVVDAGDHLNDVDHVFTAPTKALWLTVKGMTNTFRAKLEGALDTAADVTAFKALLDEMDDFADANNNEKDLKDLVKKVEDVDHSVDALQALWTNSTVSSDVKLAAQVKVTVAYDELFTKANATYQLVSDATGSKLEVALADVMTPQPWMVAVKVAPGVLYNNGTQLSEFDANLDSWGHTFVGLARDSDLDALLTGCASPDSDEDVCGQ